jgi:tetratricopeptide (TPR) repeat protein
MNKTKIILVASLFSIFIQLPRSLLAQSSRGLAKFQQKDYEGVLVDAGQAILPYPLDHFAYNLQVMGRLELGRYDESLEDCETAVSIDPRFADAYLNRARIKRVKKDLGVALSAVKQWIYEPCLIEEVPRKVIVTATVTFTLK